MRLEIPAPAPWFTPNGRQHWARTNALVGAWRRASSAHARRQQPMEFFTQPVVITAVIHKTTKRLYDPANLLGGSVKAVIDGLVDAGVLAGDDSRFIAESRIRDGEVRKPAQLVLELEVAP